MINQETYYQLEDPDVYKARALAIGVLNEDLKNKMIKREHSNYKMLADEIRAQQIKKQALEIISKNTTLSPQESTLYTNISREIATPEISSSGPVSREVVPEAEEEEEPAEEESDEEEPEEEEPLPETLQMYNNMDEIQLDIVEEAFKTDLDNIDDKEKLRQIYTKLQESKRVYGDRLNEDVNDLFDTLKEYIEDLLGIEEKAEEKEAFEGLPNNPNLKQIQYFLKSKGFKNWGGLRREQAENILSFILDGETDEKIQIRIGRYINTNKEESSKSKKRRARSKKKNIKFKIKKKKQEGNGLTQLGGGLKDDLQKVMLLVGAKDAGNDSLKLEKEIIKIQRRLKKKLDKMKQVDREKLKKEIERQMIKKLAKSKLE